jgi:putative transposase
VNSSANSTNPGPYITLKYCVSKSKIFFDPEADFQVYQRNLPHRRQAGVTYFVTFQLADSLPAQNLAPLEEQRELWLASSPRTPNSRRQRNFSKRIHEWLEAGHGGCVLTQVRRPRLTW